MSELLDLIEDVKQAEMSANSMFSQKEIEEKRKRILELEGRK